MLYTNRTHRFGKNKFNDKRLFFVLALLAFCLVCKGFLAYKGSFLRTEKVRSLMLLWQDTPSPEEAADYLASLSSNLVLTDHFGDFSVCSVPTNSLETILTVLNKDLRIRIAEADADTTLSALEDAEFYPAQWFLNNTGEYPYYINKLAVTRPAAPDVDINLPEAYSVLDTIPSSKTVTVAIIDTGIDITHPDLAGHIWINENEIPQNGIDDDGNGYIDDVYGWDFYHNDNTVCHYKIVNNDFLAAQDDDDDTHGTHCAGIIAATGSVRGVASGIDVRILPLKIHGGSHSSGSVANAVKAIRYAQAAGADICNLSWGTSAYSALLETVMRESSMLFVVAAGNNNANNNAAPLYPASFALDNMISVAYTTPFGELAPDSNYGVSTVDLAAPGQNIYSTAVGGGYRYLSGSSMAAPVVSGVAALLYSCGDSLYPQNVKEIILQTIKPMDSLIGYVRHAGIPDAKAALDARGLLASDTKAPTLSLNTSFRTQDIVVSLQPEDLGGSGCRIISYAAGKRTVQYFRNGTTGYALTGPELLFSKPGTYTFYVSDYAGNETVQYYDVIDDTTLPEVQISYKKNASGQFVVTLNASDAESGIKRLRYLQGSHSEADFHTLGTDLNLQSPSFLAEDAGVYSIYAIDYRGNKAVYEFDLQPISTKRMFVSTLELTLEKGMSFSPEILCFPLDTTDYPFFFLSDDTIASLDENGTVTALAAGDVSLYIISGYVQKTCLIHVVDSATTFPAESERPEDVTPEIPENITTKLPEDLPPTTPEE